MKDDLAASALSMKHHISIATIDIDDEGASVFAKTNYNITDRARKLLSEQSDRRQGVTCSTY